MRLKPTLAAVAALAVLGLLIRQVTQAVHRTFGSRLAIAQLARATPASQNGLTLMEIVNVSPQHQYSFTDKGPEDNGGSSPSTEADTGLWIKLPSSVSIPMGCSGEDYSPCRDQITLTARASDGRVMPLRWRASASRSSDGPTYILASIPAGYPNSVRWADVTLEDHHGDTATWRILHLPPMQHVLAPPVTTQATFHQGNISAAAVAYRGADRGSNRTGLRVLFGLRGTITNAAHQWEVGHLTEKDEWETPNAGYRDIDNTIITKRTNNNINFGYSGIQVGWDRSQPYINDEHWVRLGAQLQEFETYNEMVTFHNVSVIQTSSSQMSLVAQPQQTVTSPSGVKVTLDDAQHRRGSFGTIGGNGYNLLVSYPQGSRYPSLPRSPLWQKHNGPMSVFVEVPKPYSSYGYSFSGTEELYSFYSDKPVPKVIANFPVIIHQRVELRMVPMTFTLPVLDKAPRKGRS